MRKKNKKPLRRRIVLRLPDLDHTKNSVLNSPSSPNSRWNLSIIEIGCPLLGVAGEQRVRICALWASFCFKS
jgi:hypothetical protein